MQRIQRAVVGFAEAIFESVAGRASRENKERARLEEAYKMATAPHRGFLFIRPNAPRNEMLYANFTKRFVD